MKIKVRVPMDVLEGYYVGVASHALANGWFGLS
jgi:hypothetical protein